MKYFFLMLLSGCLLAASGQVASTTQQSNAAVIVVENQNVLYAGVENIVRVAAPEFKTDRLRLESAQCSVKQLSAGRFAVQVAASAPPEVIIKVTALQNDGEYKVISETLFRVLRMPKPKPALGKLSGGAVKKNAVPVSEEITCSYPEGFTLSNQKLRVSAYSLVINYKDTGRSAEFFNRIENNHFTDLLKTKLSGLNSGDMFCLFGIEAKNESGQVVKLDSSLIFHVE